MPFRCLLCENDVEWCVTHSLCSKCRVIKHTITLYGDRFFETIDRVFVRNQQGQIKKEQDILKEEVKETCEKIKDDSDESYEKPKTRNKTQSKSV